MNNKKWSQLSDKEKCQALLRPAQQNATQVQQGVADIIATVKRQGDQALYDYTQRFDGVQLTTLQRSVTEDAKACEPELRQAIDQAIARVKHFHQAQHPQTIKVQTAPGVTCEKHYRAIDRVGLYIPGGSAPLISTVYMLAVPARLAGCATKVLCTPAQADGTLHHAIAYAAQQCGIDEIYLIGGAQAIAAMAYGTESIPKVDKLFGPGNQWVTEAKQQVARDPLGAQLDMPAGPSEVLVIADDHANAEFVAADLLSQAEHGPDSQVMLVCLSEDFAQDVQCAVQTQLAQLPRAEIATQALAHSVTLIADDVTQAVAISNAYAPEHLIVQCQKPETLLPAITCAGSVFVGPWTPESVGDYASGTNHVLPTYGYAHCVNGLGLRDFMKEISVQTLTPQGLQTIGPDVERIAEAEGLTAHKNAVSLRLAHLPENAAAEQTTLPSCREDIANMTPYSSARREVQHGEVWLNANENPHDVLLAQNYNRYPQPQPQSLVQRLSALYGVSDMQILICRGSDEAIDVLLRAYCQAGRDAIMTLEPTYGMYEISAQIQGAGIVNVALDPETFSLDVEAILAAWTPAVKLVFVCSPNNPTGNVLAADDITILCTQLAGKALVVVDEAYIEFAQNTASMVTQLAQHPNLVVLRTLSKAYGFAGVRCGCLLAHPEVIQILLKVLAPYPLAMPVVHALLEGLTEQGIAKARQSTASLVVQREALFAALQALPFVEHVWPSEANYLLLRVTDAKAVLAHCHAKGVVIRDRSNMLNLANCLRISVGAPEENQKLIRVLEIFA